MLARYWIVVACTVGMALALWVSARPADARDDGRYSNSPHKAWFDAQKNGQGSSCCFESDAHRYDGDYTLNPDGSVTLLLDGKPHVLPAYMLLKGLNPTGSAIWWYAENSSGGHRDYCFSPGTLG